MYNSQNKKKSQLILLMILIATITIGIGYAAITSVNMFINGNYMSESKQENFKVRYKNANITSGTGTASIDTNDDTIAYFNVTGLSKIGDKAIATYTVENYSYGIGAEISLEVSNSNIDYFNVTTTIADSVLQAGDTTTVTVTVEMIKTPIKDNIGGSVSSKLVASPIENEFATSNESASATETNHYLYTARNYNFNPQGYILNQSNSYTSYDDAITGYGYPIFVRHLVDKDGKILESYGGFKMNDKVYYLLGGHDESSLSSSNRKIFNDNISIIQDAYGISNCSYLSTENYYCTNGEFTTHVYTNGDILVYAARNSKVCDVRTSRVSCN